MAKISFHFQGILFATLIYAHAVLGLKCYICNSASDQECSMSPPPSKYLQECSQDTLEILNDMHRQTKMDEAAHQASQMNGSDPANSGAPGAPAHSGSEEAASAARPSAPPAHAFDKDDKDLAFNRTARNAPEGSPVPDSGNATAAKPAPSFSTSPINLPKEATFCRKTSYHIPQQINGPNSTFKATVRVIRSCGWIPEPTKEGSDPSQSECKWIGTEGTQIDQCVCTGEGCNAGNYLGSSLQSQTLMLLAVMTAGYIYVL